MVTVEEADQAGPAESAYWIASAILSAIIFNAVIIIALIPLALKGAAYRPIGAAPLLRRNLLIYRLGGLIVPFIGIKAIDLVVTALRLAASRLPNLSHRHKGPGSAARPATRGSAHQRSKWAAARRACNG